MASRIAKAEELVARLWNPLKGLSAHSKPMKRPDDDRIFKQSWLKRLVALLPGGRVSRIHLQEARERFITLSRLVDHYKKIEKDLQKRNYLKGCEGILRNINTHYLTRKEENLNYAWRELTRVQVTICENILCPDKLPQQVDSCREEAHRLAITNDPEVSEMLQQLAESLDETGKDNDKTKRVRRFLRVVLERYNTIRTTRIHQQFLDIRTYKFSVLILAIISVIMISNVELLARSKTNQTSGTVTQALLQNISTPTKSNGQIQLAFLPSVVPQAIESSYGIVIASPLHFLEELFRANVLAFVYLGGLTGGFFSVATRVRKQTLAPGEDVYVAWYVLTKPVVGALGAMLLYVLFQSGLVTLEMIKNLPTEPTAQVFGFAFLAGFSERMVFPNLR